MLVSRVPARARRVRRLLAVRWCRHEISQPRPGRIRNNQSRKSPSPQPIASADAPSAAGHAGVFICDAGGRSTISSPIPAQTQRRPGGRSPRSAPWRAAWASHPNTPPSRRSGRPQGSPGGHCVPCGSGSPGSRLTAAQAARGRRDAHIAVPSRSGSRPPRLRPCSGQESWHPPLYMMEMLSAARSVIPESTPVPRRRKQPTRARPITRTDHPPVLR
jgi:hypothetical protein